MSPTNSGGQGGMVGRRGRHNKNYIDDGIVTYSSIRTKRYIYNGGRQGARRARRQVAGGARRARRDGREAVHAPQILYRRWNRNLLVNTDRAVYISWGHAKG